jgi:uncharacterized membrane protein YuzA (DUF378 family)
MKDGNKGLHMFTWILLVIGGLNWGLIGIFDWNLVEVIFGGFPWLVQVVYVLVGVSALFAVAMHSKSCKMCKA